MENHIKESSEVLQRSELHRKIWAIADDVRGVVDGWDFKQYILGILFSKSPFDFWVLKKGITFAIPKPTFTY